MSLPVKDWQLMWIPARRPSESSVCWDTWWPRTARRRICAATTVRNSSLWPYRLGWRSDRFIDPGCPWQNGKDERFNGTLRDECLNMQLFVLVAEARVRVEAFRRHYNDDRPHSRLGYRTPSEFKRAWLEAQANQQDSHIPT